MIEEIVEKYWDGIFAIRFRSNCPLLLLPEQVSPFPIFPTYIVTEYPSNSPLPLVLDTVGVKEFRSPDFPCTPLPFVISRLYPALVAPANLIPLLVCPIQVFLCPGKTKCLVRYRDWGPSPPYTSGISLLLECCANSVLPTAPAESFWQLLPWNIARERVEGSPVDKVLALRSCKEYMTAAMLFLRCWAKS